MLKNQLFFLLGSITLVISGFTHNLFVDLLRDQFVSFSDPNYQDTLSQITITLFGGQYSVLSAFSGYSLSFGALVGFLGVFNLVLFRADREFVFNNKEILILNIIIVFVLLISSVLYLFYLPILSMLSVLVLFVLSLLVNN